MNRIYERNVWEIKRSAYSCCKTEGFVDIDVEIELTSGVMGLLTGLLRVRCCVGIRAIVKLTPTRHRFLIQAP